MKKLVILIVAMLMAFSVGAAAETLVIMAPHPDDGEASCGGAAINAVAAGWKVVVLTMTGGELGVPGKSQEEARALRAKEAGEASAAIGASLQFFGAIDGSLDVTEQNASKLKDVLEKLSPDVVLAPWPMDVHKDHQAAGMLAWRVFHDKRFNFELYFFETSNPPHTKTFEFYPTKYIDISDVITKKQEALFKHKSQAPQFWFDMYKLIEKFRGYEADVAYAEGYVQARNYSTFNGRPPAPAKVFK